MGECREGLPYTGPGAGDATLGLGILGILEIEPGCGLSKP